MKEKYTTVWILITSYRVMKSVALNNSNSYHDKHILSPYTVWMLKCIKKLVAYLFRFLCVSSLHMFDSYFIYNQYYFNTHRFNKKNFRVIFKIFFSSGRILSLLLTTCMIHTHFLNVTHCLFWKLYLFRKIVTL